MALRKIRTLTTVAFAAVWVSTSPAYADDQMFVDALDMIGVSVGDPATAVAVGKSVCAGFDAGTPLPTLVSRLAGDHGISVEDASLFAGFSVAEYCDHHEGALSLG